MGISSTTYPKKNYKVNIKLPEKMKCVFCGRKVTEDESFSNKHQNVQCNQCVAFYSGKLGIGVGEYCATYVWPYTDDTVYKMKEKLGQALMTSNWCEASVPNMFAYQTERYRCHSRTRGVPLDGQGYIDKYWSRFENGVEVKPEVPVDFSGKTGGVVVVQRYYYSDGVEHLEDGRIAVPLDTFRKCFKRVR